MAKKKQKIIFQSNINALVKVYSATKASQTMTGTQIILGENNRDKVQEAVMKISEAIALLNEVK